DGQVGAEVGAGAAAADRPQRLAAGPQPDDEEVLGAGAVDRSAGQLERAGEAAGDDEIAAGGEADAADLAVAGGAHPGEPARLAAGRELAGEGVGSAEGGNAELAELDVGGDLAADSDGARSG